MPPILVQSFKKLHGEAKALGKGKQGPGSPKSPELGRRNPPWAQSAWHLQGRMSVRSVLPQFPSWYEPPRSSAAGTQGLSKQLSRNENFHPPFLSCNQDQREKSPQSAPSLPVPRHSQPGVLPAPLLVKVSILHCTQHVWEPALEKHSRVSQGTGGNCLSPPHPVHAPMPGTRQAAASSREVCAGMGRAVGTLHTPSPGLSKEHPAKQSWPCSHHAQSPPSRSRLCQVCPVHTTQHSLSIAGQLPLCPPTLPKGHREPWGEPGAGSPACTHPA